MDYCEKGDLESQIQQCRAKRIRIPEDTIWNYLAQILAGLEACHYHGCPDSDNLPDEVVPSTGTSILHRDIKPANIFIDSSGTLKLADFGLSKEMAPSCFTESYVGTPLFIAPEMALKTPYNAKSDIWSVGCVAYELCSLT